MNKRFLSATCAAILSAALCSHAIAAEKDEGAKEKVSANAGNASVVASANEVALRGHTYPKTIALEGKNLVLNGVGTRIKLVVPVYTAALYTDKPVRSAQQFYANQGAKRIHMTFLRKITSDQLGDMFLRAIKNNITTSKIDPTKTLVGVSLITKAANDSGGFVPNDTLYMDWIPGKGTVIYVRGTQYGKPVPEPEFWHALSAIWMGDAPADWQLKDALLGVAKK